MQVSKTLGVFDSLLSLHSQVSSSSAAMSSNTEALLAQKATLTEFAEALRARLKFFDEYELAANQFASAAANPDSADLMPLLHKLDECVSYVAANPQYADAVTYANKFRQLQLKALGLVRGRVQSVLRSAAHTVQVAVAEAVAGGAAGAAAAPAQAGGAAAAGGRLSGRSNSGVLAGGRVPVLPEGQEVSLLYVRFRAAAEPALKGSWASRVLDRLLHSLLECTSWLGESTSWLYVCFFPRGHAVKSWWRCFISAGSPCGMIKPQRTRGALHQHTGVHVHMKWQTVSIVCTVTRHHQSQSGISWVILVKS